MIVNTSAKSIYDALKKANLRPTRQRLELLGLLTADGDRHVTPEMLHAEAREAGIRVSLATVYNTLNQFTDCELLRRLSVEPGKTYFDTNTSNHHHFYDANEQLLKDLPADSVYCSSLPKPPPGKKVDRVDIIIRIS